MLAVRRRNPDQTRERLLDSAFLEIYQHGFQAASLDAIVEGAAVSKGALYHHFSGKHELGYAVLDEVIGRLTTQRWMDPVTRATDPLAAIVESMRAAFQTEFANGCPLNNLAQEMSGVDPEFHRRIAATYHRWEHAIAAALESGQRRGLVQQGIDAASAATFVVASIEGAYSLAKGRQDRGPLLACLDGMTRYLESLRTHAAGRDGH